LSRGISGVFFSGHLGRYQGLVKNWKRVGERRPDPKREGTRGRKEHRGEKKNPEREVENAFGLKRLEAM